MRPGECSERVAAIATLAALKGISPPATVQPAGLALSASSIGNKFGFYDGNTPDATYDMLYDWYRPLPSGVGGFWRAVLWRIAHEHLIPEVTEMMDTAGTPLPPLAYVDTIHNPVRFANKDMDWSMDPSTLPDLTVHVPWLVVLAHCVVEIDSRLAAQDPA